MQTGGLLKDLSVRETVAYTASLFADTAPVDEVLRTAGIEAIADRKVGKCSGGEQQRLRFAMALLPDPALLLRIAAQAEATAAVVEAGPRRQREILRLKQQMWEDPPPAGERMAHFEECVVSGRANPMGVVMDVRDDTENGVTFEGEHGRIFVTRDRLDLSGGSVSTLYENPVPESLLVDLRKGQPVEGHMENFLRCCRDRKTPASDVWSHHRALTTCHLANIAMRLGNRTLTWDPEAEQIVGDPEANGWLTRPQREEYAVTA